MRLLTTVVLLIAGALIVGCAKPGNIVGKWKVDPALTGAGASPEQKASMIGFASTFYFEFKADKTFTGAITEGTYSFDGHNLRMKTTKVMGQDVSRAPATAGATEMTGELSGDGKTLLLHPSFVDLSDAIKNGVPMVRDGPS